MRQFQAKQQVRILDAGPTGQGTPRKRDLKIGGTPIGEMAVEIQESPILGVAMVMAQQVIATEVVLEPVPQLHREVHQQVGEEEP